MIVDLVRDDVKALRARGGAGSVPAATVVQFVAGGLFGLLMWWLEARVRPSAEELSQGLRRLAIPAVTAAVP